MTVNKNLCIYIDTNGKIRVNEFPERPNVNLTCSQPCEGQCGDICPIIADNRKVLQTYESAVQAALDNGVVCEDQEEGRKLIEKTYCEANRISPLDFIPTNNFPYPIHDNKMEVKTPNWIHPEKKLATLTLISNV